MKKSIIGKALAGILAAVIIFTLVSAPVRGYAAASQETAADSFPESMIAKVGRYDRTGTPAMTQALMDIFDKGIKDFTGSAVPVAYLGKMSTAGTLYVFACRIKEDQETAETYAIISLYEDLQGNVNINTLYDTNIETEISGQPGGWSEVSSPKISKSLKKSLKKALKGKTDATLSPFALLAEREEEGKNYCVLCLNQDKPEEDDYYIAYCHQETKGSLTVGKLLSLQDAIIRKMTAQFFSLHDFDMDTAVKTVKLINCVNTNENILSKHKSVLEDIWQVIDDTPGYSGIKYHTKDMIYRENQGISIMVDGRKEYYVVWTDEGESQRVYGLDMTPDHELYDRVLSENSGIDLDVEQHEKIVSFEVGEGTITIITTCDSEIKDEYRAAGITINEDSELINVYCADAWTYEMIRISSYVINDGIATQVLRNDYYYDRTEPSSSIAFREAFEYEGEKKMTVTIVADPDTDHEVTASMTLPVYSDFIYYYGTGINTQQYEDRECTILPQKKWNRKSDKLIYLKTDRK